MEAKHKAGFRIDNEPEIVFPTSNLDHGFVRMPLVRAKVEGRNKLQGDVLKEWREAGTPVGNGGVR